MLFLGIGKKIVERLVVELCDRLVKFIQFLFIFDIFMLGQDLDVVNINMFVLVNDVKEEVVSVLVVLGYKLLQVSKMVNSVFEDGMSSEVFICQVFKMLLQKWDLV